jgi:hypothetical protein
MKTKSLLALLAVGGLVVAQPALAATRSYESLPASSAAVPADRSASIVTESEALRGSPVIPIVLVAVILAALLALSGGSGATPGQSPG